MCVYTYTHAVTNDDAKMSFTLFTNAYTIFTNAYTSMYICVCMYSYVHMVELYIDLDFVKLSNDHFSVLFYNFYLFFSIKFF